MIVSRTSSDSGCPYCHSANRGEMLSKALVKIGNNALFSWYEANGDYEQQLIKEWLGIDKNGNTINMNELAKASHTKVW